MYDINKQIILPNEHPPIKDLRKFKETHHMGLLTPSISSSYSICVEYIREWFKDKFQDSYFKAEYVSGRNILHDYLNKDVIDYIKKNKPALLISPHLDYEFNRDNLDLYEFGKHISINRMRYNDVFFKSNITDNLASISMKQIRVTFNIRVKVNSYNHALDLYEYMKRALRVGASETRYADLDFQVPKELMLAIARDANFEIVNNEIADMCSFLRYVNQHSRLSIIYKFRGTKGEYEFFIRMPNMYIHLKTNDIDVDEGERDGQTDNNFIVSIGEIECLFPAPMHYAYFSPKQYPFTAKVLDTSNKAQYRLYTLCLCNIPHMNEKGWKQYMTTDYVEDKQEDGKGFKNVSIGFEELLHGSTKYSLFEISEFTKKLFLSPNTFMDIKLYNSNKEIPIDIDWNTYTIQVKDTLADRVSQVVFYVDLEYINNYILRETQAVNKRIVDQENYK